MSLFDTEHDQRYFDIFCTRTAFEILPCFETDTLREILFQACVSTPSIRHAVVALGALDMTAEIMGGYQKLDLDEQKESPHQHHQAALRQYATAIKEMRASAERGHQDLQITLLTCLVILCFEAWNGNSDLAVRQIQAGLQLIEAWRTDLVLEQQRLGAISPSQEELVKTFSKLDVQAISFAESTPERHALVLTSEHNLLSNMPPIFTSVPEATIYEQAILRQSMRFLASQVPLSKPTPPKRAFPVNAWWGVTDPTAVSIQQNAMKNVTNWLSAFSPLWHEMKAQHTPHADMISTSTSPPPLFNAAVLKLHMQTVLIAQVAICASTEMIFDAYIPTFSSIVSLSTYVLRILNRHDTPSSRKGKFSFDSHVIIPLHMVAHKCRDRKIRRQAIDLLVGNPRREGVWDSMLGGQIGAWAMSVEEEFCGEGGGVPEWARIHGVYFERDRVGRSALLSCEQRVSGESEDVVVRKKIVTW